MEIGNLLGRSERVRDLDWGFDCGIGLADPRIYFVAPGW